MQELFFVIGALVELFTAMICLRFLVAMYSKKETGKIANISWEQVVTIRRG